MSYSNAILSLMEQRSDEWFEIRRPNLTASNFGDWLTKSTATAKKARTTAIAKVIAAKAGCEEPPRYETWAMARGNELESAALAVFCSQAKKKARVIGFAQCKEGAFGCSPDGLIDDEGNGVELKCPMGPTHAKYLLNGTLPAEYKPQVHGSMAVTGADSWYFASFCPGLPLFWLKVERDEYTELVLAGLKGFDEELANAETVIEEMKYTPKF